ncbi:MAG TPA: hypothetical protein VFS21_00605 [Roseiflexaceae bacterium]|nr:hypothetical protein [Roseiflexaceae bacterium]
MTVLVTMLICPIEWRNFPVAAHREPFVALEWQLHDSQIGANSAVIDIAEPTVVYRCYEAGGALRTEGRSPLRALLMGLCLSPELAERLDLDGNYTLLFLYVRLAESERVYSCTAFLRNRFLFLNTGVQPLGPQESPDATVIRDRALLAHDTWRLFLNNHNNFNFFKKYLPDDEIEYKYNLAHDTNIWRLSNRLWQRIEQGGLPGFTPHFAHPTSQWDFDNYLFEISAPAEEKGYISFIPTARGTYIIKKKVYAEDSLIRKEYRQREVTIVGALDEYLREHFPSIVYRQLPHFRRIRYDVDIESLVTGNIYSVMFDRSTVRDQEYPPLVQCEVEYLQTRSCYPPRCA